MRCYITCFWMGRVRTTGVVFPLPHVALTLPLSNSCTATPCGGEVLHVRLTISRTRTPDATPYRTSPPLPDFRTLHVSRETPDVVRCRTSPPLGVRYSFVLRTRTSRRYVAIGMLRCVCCSKEHITQHQLTNKQITH